MKLGNIGKPKNISIKSKLLFSYLVLIFAPLLVLTSLTYARVSSQMESTMLRNSQNALAQSEAYLQTKLSAVGNAAGIMYFNQTLQDIYTINPAIYDEDLMQQAVDQKSLMSLINQIEENPDVYRVRIYLRNIDGYYYDQQHFYIFQQLDGQPWYEKLKASSAMLVWIAPSYLGLEDDGTTPIVSLASKIRIRSFNLTEGVIRIDMRERVVHTIVSQANVTATGLTYLVNEEGDIISAAGNKQLLDNTALRHAAEQNDTTESRIHAEGNSYIRLIREVPGSDWRFVALIPYNEIKATGHDIRLYMIATLCITGIIAYLIAYLGFNASAKRLKHLARHIRKVTEGDFKSHIRVASTDEIGQISRDFNYMVQEMATMINERFETGKKIKSLELRSLQSQINPHFLYNSLDMINWSAMMNDNAEIGQMVKELSRFYKIGLSNGADIIALHSELEHVKAYVSLQNFRFENQIRLELEVEQEALDCEIPKITLQPIVENAILHGIFKKPCKSGTIRITGSKKAGNLVIAVSDDGVGMSEHKLMQVLDAHASEGDARGPQGYGLKNINDRIILQYGSVYGLSFKSTPGAGTTVTVLLPAILMQH